MKGRKLHTRDICFFPLSRQGWEQNNFLLFYLLTRRWTNVLSTRGRVGARILVGLIPPTCRWSTRSIVVVLPVQIVFRGSVCVPADGVGSVRHRAVWLLLLARGGLAPLRAACSALESDSWWFKVIINYLVLYVVQSAESVDNEETLGVNFKIRYLLHSRRVRGGRAGHRPVCREYDTTLTTVWRTCKYLAF